MEFHALIQQYVDLLRPHFGALLRVDDSEEEKEWVAIMLDGSEEEFFFSLYGMDCVHLYWCNECFILDCHRESLVSSDTYGEIGAVDKVPFKNLYWIIEQEKRRPLVSFHGPYHSFQVQSGR